MNRIMATILKQKHFSGIFFGLIVLVTSFAVGKLGSIAMHAIHVLEAAFCGPILGLYISGIFSPWTNKIVNCFFYF